MGRQLTSVGFLFGKGWAWERRIWKGDKGTIREWRWCNRDWLEVPATALHLISAVQRTINLLFPHYSHPTFFPSQEEPGIVFLVRVFSPWPSYVADIPVPSPIFGPVSQFISDPCCRKLAYCLLDKPWICVVVLAPVLSCAAPDWTPWADSITLPCLGLLMDAAHSIHML